MNFKTAQTIDSYCNDDGWNEWIQRLWVRYGDSDFLCKRSWLQLYRIRAWWITTIKLQKAQWLFSS